MVTFTDPLFARQWHFNLMGDIRTIWNEYSGAGVTVGVYDDGVQYTHADLNDNYDATLHFQYGGAIYDAYPINTVPGADADGHGTSVAGLIAAEAGNGIGGVGVAWGATLTGMNMLSEPRLDADFGIELAAYRHAGSFDIMSNSWGYDPYFNEALNRGDPLSTGAATIEAFGDVAATGRGGLGTIIVKAAGNDRANANGEGINGSRFVVSVAALTSTGAVASYSNFGTNILIAAGAASVTTDLMGGNGYNTTAGIAGDYTSTFGGTSAATPVVSGVVALMLEANNALGWRDVREILATSAALTGSGIGAAAPDEVEGFYSQLSGNNWNGGGHAISRDYGYGRVDAFAAVRMAEAWRLWADTAKTSANEITASVQASLDPGGFAFAGAMDTPLEIDIAVSAALTIAHIDVSFTVDYAFFQSTQPQYAEFYLMAPDGTRFDVFSSTDLVDRILTADISGTFRWTFGVAHALGMLAQGVWAFGVEGDLPGNSNGVITNVTLDFYGSAPDVSGDDVHHITKDFLTITGTGAAHWNGGRDRVLADANGGNDWINMASIAGPVNMTLYANGNGRISVAGQQWATLATGSQFENVVTGDGADAISGNPLANEIHAMRGNDTVYGLVGNDSLHGGAGNDRLFGGPDADLLFGDQGDDILDGGMGNDTVAGGAGSDRISERMGGGDDVVDAGTGADTVYLGTGNDTFEDNAETGAAGGDTVSGGTGNDLLFGAGGTDRLSGDAGNDSMTGGEGNDTLNGGAGLDTLAGGTGNDALTGGGDADVFVFGADFGIDRITDFQNNIDTLAFDAAFWNGIADAVDFVDTFAHLARSYVVFDFGGGAVVTVSGVRTLAALYDDVTMI